MTEWFEGRSIDEKMERCYWRRVAFVILFALGLALLLAPMIGCTSAPERYLSAEQDAEFRENCEAHGCIVMPTPIWVQIEAILKRSGAI